MIRKSHLNVVSVLLAVAAGATAAADAFGNGDLTGPTILLAVSVGVAAAIRAYETNSE